MFFAILIGVAVVSLLVGAVIAYKVHNEMKCLTYGDVSWGEEMKNGHSKNYVGLENLSENSGAELSQGEEPIQSDEHMCSCAIRNRRPKMSRKPKIPLKPKTVTCEVGTCFKVSSIHCCKCSCYMCSSCMGNTKVCPKCEGHCLHKFEPLCIYCHKENDCYLKPCMHIFHKFCLMEWYEKNKENPRCPQCCFGDTRMEGNVKVKVSPFHPDDISTDFASTCENERETSC